MKVSRRKLIAHCFSMGHASPARSGAENAYNAFLEDAYGTSESGLKRALQRAIQDCDELIANPLRDEDERGFIFEPAWHEECKKAFLEIAEFAGIDLTQ